MRYVPYSWRQWSYSYGITYASHSFVLTINRSISGKIKWKTCCSILFVCAFNGISFGPICCFDYHTAIIIMSFSTLHSSPKTKTVKFEVYRPNSNLLAEIKVSTWQWDHEQFMQQVILNFISSYNYTPLLKFHD